MTYILIEIIYTTLTKKNHNFLFFIQTRPPPVVVFLVCHKAANWHVNMVNTSLRARIYCVSPRPTWRALCFPFRKNSSGRQIRTNVGEKRGAHLRVISSLYNWLLQTYYCWPCMADLSCSFQPPSLCCRHLAPVAETRLPPYKIVGHFFGRSYLRFVPE